MKKIIFIV
jgi:class 4 POU domain transcription factor